MPIRPARFYLAALCLAACGFENHEDPPAMPAVAIDPGCGMLLGKPRDDVAIQRFLGQVSQDWTKVRFAEPYEPLRDHPVAAGLSFFPGCPSASYLLGDGVVADVTVHHHTDQSANVVLQSAYLVNEGGVVTVHANVPRAVYASMSVTAAHGEIWVSIQRRWLVADLRLDVTSATGRIALAGLSLETPRALRRHGRSGFRLTAVEMAGGVRISREHGDPWLLGPDGMFVLAGLPPGPTRIHLRLEGWPPVSDPMVGHDSALIAGIVPHVPFQRAFPYALRIHHPSDEVVAAGGVVSRPVAGKRWQVLDVRSEGSESVIMLVQRSRNMAPTVIEPFPGARITMAESGQIDECRVGVARAAAGLASLGPLGSVVMDGFILPPSRWGYQSARLAMLDAAAYQDLCQGPDHVASALSVALGAHELAHTWFGAEVSAGGDEAVAWWEALAEYVSAWSLEARDALDLRARWAKLYAAASASDTVAMNRRYFLPRSVSDPFSYAKGALLMTALEDRVGKARVVAALRRFIADNRGRAGSWAAVASAVRAEAGDDAARWLETWLGQPGAPALTLTGVAVGGGRVHATLIQAAPAFPGAVELGFLRGDAVIARTSVVLGGERTAIDLAVPPGADALAIDPEHRLPLRFDPAADPIAAGRRTRLARE